MNKYMVTGAAGFIGSKVCEFLLDAGHEVVGVDDLNDYYDVRLKDWRLNRLKDRDGFTFHQEDVADLDAMRKLFEGASYDAVLNLAARAGVRYSTENPWIYERTNTLGTLNLLDLCRKHGIKQFVLASTSSLYGTHNDLPYSEDANTDRPLSPYAATKKGAESLAASYSHLYGINVAVVRYFTVYGPAGRPDMSVFRFIKWIAEGKPLVLYGNGEQSRDFTFVDDIAKGTIAASKVQGSEVINLGGDSPHSMNEMIQKIEALLGKKASVDSRPMHKADVLATWANIDKAKRLLGWSPSVSFDEGLRRTVGWYQQNAEWLETVNTEDS